MWEGVRRPAVTLDKKLEAFLAYFFRRLHYDPQLPDADYSSNQLLRTMKKVDSEMGS